MATLYDRRALFVRYKKQSSYPGRQSVKLADGITCRYNWNLDKTILDYVFEHAQTSEGKVLFPLKFNVSDLTVSTCKKAYLWMTDDTYIEADIHDAGPYYAFGMDDHDGFTAPPGLTIPEARCWMKLEKVSNIKQGFPIDAFSIQAYKGGGIVKEASLRETLKTTHMNCMYITRNEK